MADKGATAAGTGGVIQKYNIPQGGGQAHLLIGHVRHIHVEGDGDEADLFEQFIHQVNVEAIDDYGDTTGRPRLHPVIGAPQVGESGILPPALAREVVDEISSVFGPNAVNTPRRQ